MAKAEIEPVALPKQKIGVVVKSIFNKELLNACVVVTIAVAVHPLILEVVVTEYVPAGILEMRRVVAPVDHRKEVLLGCTPLIWALMPPVHGSGNKVIVADVGGRLIPLALKVAVHPDASVTVTG